MPDPSLHGGFDLPFTEQSDFFRNKLDLPTETRQDVMHGAHDRAFVVAGAAKADLLADLHAAVQKAIDDGTSLETFRQDFRAIVAKHGWVDFTGSGTPGGFAWRTKVIYETNLRSSYAAGRYAQLTDPDFAAARPYWRYVHSDSVMHPRPLHVAWNGKVIPDDDPWWKTHYPPNGWGCKCRVHAIAADQLGKYGKTAPDAAPNDGDTTWTDQAGNEVTVPRGIDPGWGYAPGASTATPLKDLIDQKLIRLDAPIGAAMMEALKPALQAEQAAAWRDWLGAVMADPVKRGRIAVVGSIAPAILDWLAANKAISPATAEIAVQDGLVVGKKAERHTNAGDALSEAEWARLPDMLADPDQVLYDTRSGKLIYVAASDDPRQAKLAIEFNFKLKKGKSETNQLVSAFKTTQAAIDGETKGGFFEVVE